jgi:hypothetical protein
MLMSLIISSRNITIYGLIGSLSPLYFLAVMILISAFLMTLKSNVSMKWIQICQIVLFEMYLWAIPAFYYAGLRFPASAHDLFFYSDIASVMNKGHLEPNVYQYQGWPLPYILVAVVWRFLGPVPYLVISKVTPLLMNLFVSLTVFNLLKSYLGSENSQLAGIGVIVFQLFNYTEQFTTIAPFAISYVLYYACTFYLLAQLIKVEKARFAYKEILIFMLFILALSFAHPVIDAILVFGLTFIFLSGRFISKKFVLPLFTLSVFSLIAWSLFFPSLEFVRHTLQFFLSEPAKILSSFLGGTVSSFEGTSGEHLFVNETRIVVLFMFVVTALPAVLSGFRVRDRIFLLTLFCIGTLLASLTIGSLQGGNINVYWLASIFPILILFDMVTLLRIRKVKLMPLLLIVLVISVPASFLVLYGNIATESVPQPTLFLSQFFSEYDNLIPNPGSQTLLAFGLVGYYGPNLGTLSPYLYSEAAPYVSLAHLTESFVEIGPSDGLAYLYQYGNDSIIESTWSILVNLSSYNLVYSSAEDSLFYNVIL